MKAEEIKSYISAELARKMRAHRFVAKADGYEPGWEHGHELSFKVSEKELTELVESDLLSRPSDNGFVFEERPLVLFLIAYPKRGPLHRGLCVYTPWDKCVLPHGEAENCALYWSYESEASPSDDADNTCTTTTNIAAASAMPTPK